VVEGFCRHFEGPRVCSAALGDVVFNLYVDTPSCEDLDELSAVQRSLVERTGRRVGVLSLVEPGLGLPSQEVRKHASELNKEVESVVAVSATVIMGAGFWMSAALSLVNTVLLIGSSTRPNRIYRDLEPGVTWIVDHIEGADVPSVIGAFEEWRADMVTRRAG